MTGDAERDAGQQLDNSPDVFVEAKPGTVHVAGQAADVAALNLYAERLQHLLDAQTPEWREQWGGDIEDAIRAMLGRGAKPGLARDKFLAWYDVGHAAGRKRAELVREASSRSGSDPGTFRRWLRQSGRN
jgi:hypothetical protein